METWVLFYFKFLGVYHGIRGIFVKDWHISDTSFDY